MLKPPTHPFQVRTEEGGVTHYKSFEEALVFAEANNGWKISFTVYTKLREDRIRLIREGDRWVYQDIFGNYGSRGPKEKM